MLVLQMSHDCRNTCFTLFFLLFHNKIPPQSTVLSRPHFFLLCGGLKSLVSESWATTRSHPDLFEQEGEYRRQKSTSVQNHAKMLARGPRLHETACHQVGKVGQKGYPGQMDGSVRPICFHHENLTAHTYATHTTSVTTSYYSWSPPLPVKL